MCVYIYMLTCSNILLRSLGFRSVDRGDPQQRSRGDLATRAANSWGWCKLPGAQMRSCTRFCVSVLRTFGVGVR